MNLKLIINLLLTTTKLEINLKNDNHNCNTYIKLSFTFFKSDIVAEAFKDPLAFYTFNTIVTKVRRDLIKIIASLK